MEKYFYRVVSINKPIQESFKIYPNPARSQLILESQSQKQGFYYISDLTGRKLLEGKIQKGRTSIELTGLKSGIYFITLRNGKAVSTNKFIKW